MFEQLINLVKENAQDVLVKNDAVPNQHNDAAINEAGNVIQDVLGSAVKSGNMQDVLGMFGNIQNLQANPLVGKIVSELTGKLGAKFGIDAGQAQSIAASLIPKVLSHFAKKTNDPGDSSLNINDVMNNLSGGKTQGTDFGNVVSQMQNGQNVDLGGLTSNILGDKAGGISDMLGGIFKK